MINGIRNRNGLEKRMSRAHNRRNDLLSIQEKALKRFEETCSHIKFVIEITGEGHRDYIPLCKLKIEIHNRNISKDEVEEILSDKVDDKDVYIRNHSWAICDCYNPGSTFPSIEDIKACDENPDS